MTQHNGEEYMSAEEAASRMGVSRRTIERYAENGKLKKYRKGLRILYKLVEVEQLKREHEGIYPVNGE